jgi:hypothetical protein
MAVLDKTSTFISRANQGSGLATATILARDYNYHIIIGSCNIKRGAKPLTSFNPKEFQQTQFSWTSNAMIQLQALQLTSLKHMATSTSS